MRLDIRQLLGGRSPGGKRDPLAPWRIALAVLLVLNAAALAMVVFPPGGSVESLDQELSRLRIQVQSNQEAVQRLRAVVKKVESARSEQDAFMRAYFIDLDTASSTIQTEILNMAKTSGLRSKEHSYVLDPIEGSDTLSLMTITANYEGSYADLVEFVSLVDRSERFLIIDNIQATPQQTPGLLNARFKMNAFLREGLRRAPAESRTTEDPAPAVAALTEARR
jgi:Tfp pilus assembly protein PilO